MSDGGEERNREAEQNARRRIRPEDFSRAVAKIAVAQVSESVGFEGVKQSAIDALSNIAIRYICDLGKSAKFYAELAGRSESNVFDVAKGLEDLSSTRGFSGASEAYCCAAESGALSDVMDYVANVDEIPFARSPVPQFPISRMHSFLKRGGSSSVKHIPEWLPLFPEPHAYLSKKIEVKRELQQRIVSGASAGPSTRGLECNEFLNPALAGGEKEVSEIAVPTRLVRSKEERGAFVEVFAPAINATNVGDVDSTDSERRLPLEGRPVVQFRLKTGKKLLREDVDVGLRDGGDDRRDEKKRRGEQILQQAVINPQDTSQNVN